MENMETLSAHVTLNNGTPMKQQRCKSSWVQRWACGKCITELGEQASEVQAQADRYEQEERGAHGAEGGGQVGVDHGESLQQAGRGSNDKG